jgi:hypothetical protein
MSSSEKKRKVPTLEPTWPIGSLIVPIRTLSVRHKEYDYGLKNIGCKLIIDVASSSYNCDLINKNDPLLYIGNVFSSYEDYANFDGKVVIRYLIFLNSNLELVAFLYRSHILYDIKAQKNELSRYFQCILRSDNYI